MVAIVSIKQHLSKQQEKTSNKHWKPIWKNTGSEQPIKIATSPHSANCDAPPHLSVVKKSHTSETSIQFFSYFQAALPSKT